MTTTRLAASPDRPLPGATSSPACPRPQKRLPCKYFYDAAGSRLFDAISELPEYYPTRTELAILRAARRRDGRAAAARGCLLVELGSGSRRKTRLLLDRLDRPAGYVPVDISGEHLRAAAAALAGDYPGLAVLPGRRRLHAAVRAAARRAGRGRRVVFFPGSTIGNFDPAEADALLRRIGPAGRPRRRAAARRRPAEGRGACWSRRTTTPPGVTAAFNLNLLVRINRELGGRLRPGRLPAPRLLQPRAVARSRCTW